MLMQTEVVVSKEAHNYIVKLILHSYDLIGKFQP